MSVLKYIFLLPVVFATACQSMQEQTLTIKDVELTYLVTGNGPPLYLLHGGMESRDSFSNQIASLAEHFTVVAPDSREQGRSSSSETQITYKRMAADIAALAEHLGHDEIYLMGQSDGGVTGLTLALESPALLKKMILVGTNYNYLGYAEETRNFITNYRWDGDTNPEGYPGMFIKYYLTGHEDLSEFGATLNEMARMWTTSPNFSQNDLKSILLPTLIINGDREDVPLPHVVSLHESLPNSDLLVMPDSTHFLHQEKPEQFNQIVLDFLKSD